MKTNQKGFTLIELMIVVAIIGILASVGLPSYQSYVSKAEGSAALQELNQFRLDTSEYFSIEGELRGGVAFLSQQAGEAGETQVTLTARVNDEGTGVFFVCETSGVKFKDCANSAEAAEALTALNNLKSIADGIVVGQDNGEGGVYLISDKETAEANVAAAQAEYDAKWDL